MMTTTFPGIDRISSGLGFGAMRLPTQADGKIDQAQMRKNRFTLDELFEELRQQGVTDLSTIERAVLETGGNLNVVLFPAQQPPTCAQLGIEVPPARYPTILINDGRVLSRNLRVMGLDESWLAQTLRDRGLDDPADVYLMTIDGAGTVCLAEMERQG